MVYLHIGTLGKGITPGSKEYAEISDIYVGNSNAVHNNGSVYVVNENSFDYGYPVYTDDNYIDFDKLYASIMNEQTSLTTDANYISSNTPYISEPGKYSISSSATRVSISNYDPNELYIIRMSSTEINSFPKIEIRYSDFDKYETDGDVVYCGRKDSEEDCGGNIIWVFPNARYIKTDYSTIGHIIAPKADIELVESHYPGSIIANSITATANTKTAIQFYPYNLNKELVLDGNVTKGYTMDVLYRNNVIDTFKIDLRTEFLDYNQDVKVEHTNEYGRDILKHLDIRKDFNTIKKLFETDGQVSRQDKDGNLLEEHIGIKTGDKVIIKFKTTEYFIHLSVKGDVRGTGKIEEYDAFESYDILRRKKQVESHYKIAGDINEDGKLKINDVAKLYQYTKNKIESLED